jgi:hypothetical protein
MGFKLEHLEGCNYIEVVMFRKKECDNNYEISFTDLECDAYIDTLMKHDKKLILTNKEERYIIHKGMKLTSTTAKDGTKQEYVTAPILLKKNEIDTKMICLYYDKQIIPTHSFPSSKEYFDICDVKRTTIRILNNLYLNFESVQYQDKSVYNTIYFNVNNRMGLTDVYHVSDKINEYINRLKLASIC